MNANHRVVLAFLGAIGSALAAPLAALADPLPGRDQLKFQQLPLDNLTYHVGDPINGFVPTTYWGHDNFSTAYDDGSQPAPRYIGRFMADDFADPFSSPVVHVRWWGSYPVFNPDFPVDKFLISFEEDVPPNTGQFPTSFSRPGTPLLNQVVTRGPLSPGSGTFTERPYSPGGPPLLEQVYEYNAELHLNQNFFQQPDTVYWLKIVALVDAPGIAIDPSQPIPSILTQWGWHNRDYTKRDPLASTSPAVVPGEHLAFFVPSTPGVQAFHFQDDAVSGNVVVDFAPVVVPGPGPAPLFPTVLQDARQMLPTNYLDLIDGPGTGSAGLPGIGQYSQDLAFELYTVVPEPAACFLALWGLSLLTPRRR